MRVHEGSVCLVFLEFDLWRKGQPVQGHKGQTDEVGGGGAVAACYLPMIGDQLSDIRAHFRFAPSQWQMSLQSNTVSHWLGASQKISSGYWKPRSVWGVTGLQTFLQIFIPQILYQHLPLSIKLILCDMKMATILQMTICNASPWMF